MSKLKTACLFSTAVIVLASCGSNSTESGADRATKLADEMGVKQAGWARVEEKSVYLRHVKDGAWHTVTYSDGKGSDQGAESSDPGYKAVPLADLKVADLDAKLAENKGECDGKAVAEVSATQGGALVQQVMCGQKVLKTYLDGTEVKPMKAWDPASIDSALADLAKVSGPDSTHLIFQTEKSGAIRGGVAVRDVSVPVKGVKGDECVAAATRAGAINENLGLVYVDACEAPEGKAGQPFKLTDANGAAVTKGLATAAQKMGIKPEEIGVFQVRSEGGKLTLQAEAGDGVPAKSPAAKVPLG